MVLLPLYVMMSATTVMSQVAHLYHPKVSSTAYELGARSLCLLAVPKLRSGTDLFLSTHTSPDPGHAW